MPYDPGAIAANNASRERLKKIAALDDRLLETPLYDDWRVSTALAHVAFWDRRAVYLIELWERDGASPAVPDPDSTNFALQAFFDAAPPRAIAEIAVQAAEAMDRKMETLSDALIEHIRTTHPFALVRAAHRNEHLDEIEHALAEHTR